MGPIGSRADLSPSRHTIGVDGPPPRRPQQSFPELEQEVLERWRERDVFHESIRRRQGAEPWVFYEGPPTANGRPGAHHVLARVFKDIYPRFKTMRGPPRRAQGRLGHATACPVEIAVQKQLGIDNKKEIEEYGIAEFNQKCRESVFEFLEDWNALTERIGFWVDLDDAYRTLDTTYIESVWWALRQIYDKGLLYEGHKVVPYCPGCGTALSSPRGRARLQGRHRPVGLRALPRRRGRRAGAARRRAARLDDDAVDARVQRRGRRRPRADVRAREDRAARGAGDPRRGARRARARRRRRGQDPRPLPGRRARRRALRAAVPVHPGARSTASAGTPSCSATSSPPTTAPASSTPRSRSARTTSGSASATG